MRYNWPLINDNITQSDRLALSNFCLYGERFTNGEKVKEFEKAWSEWLGVKHSVMVNSGASANFISIAMVKELLGVGEIIVPPIGWVSDISSVVQLGMTPVFVDVDINNFNITAENIKAAITKVYKANDEILLSLRKSSAKFNEASISSKVYLSACSFALYSYYSKSNPLETDKVELLTKLKSAEINYLVVLAKETLFAKIARGILMSVTTFIATILVVPLVIHYQNTGRVMFFGAPSAQLKLQDMHYKLDAEIKNNVNSPGT